MRESRSWASESTQFDKGLRYRVDTPGHFPVPKDLVGSQGGL